MLTDAGLDLVQGEVTALVGPNGSGKSTLLRVASRLLRPDGGVVALDDVDDIRVLTGRQFARRVALLSQQRPTPAGITVHDVVEYGRHPHRTGWRGRDAEGREAVERALAWTGLEPLASVTVDTLSGGQLQRTWFASALAQDAGVLLLDEPTNHLDLRYQMEVLDLIQELAAVRGAAVGVVLHDLNHAAEIADRVVVLHQGSVVADGRPEVALDPELLTEVYEIPISVSQDDVSGVLEIRARRARADTGARA